MVGYLCVYDMVVVEDVMITDSCNGLLIQDNFMLLFQIFPEIMWCKEQWNEVKTQNPKS